MTTLKFLLLFLFIFSAAEVNAQFLKKLKKQAEEAVKETVIQKSEEKAAETTGQVMDSIFDAPGKIKKSKQNGQDEETDETKISEEQSIIVNANFDFKPGALVFFYDDFRKDGLGDFPAKWDTNGSGELVEVEGEKWFRLANNSVYTLLTDNNLPENYTIEFDLLTTGLDKKTSSQAFLTLIFSDGPGFGKGNTWSMVELSPCQFIGNNGAVEKVVKGKRQLRNNVGKDYRNAINGYSRISIAVNKTRLRLWLNENKLVDIPRLIGNGINTFKMSTKGFRDERNVDEILIKDFRIAETGDDYRSKLLTEGRVSTNAILFESGSANLKPESNAIISEIANVLLENPEVNIKIIGHTDADGTESTNMELSKSRAEAVKAGMSDKYGIESERIVTEGKGESQPIADNNSPENKAKNRRVEFIKI